jgi:hypothetical protein
VTQAAGHPLGLAVPHVRRAHRPVGPLRVHGRPEGLHHVRQEPVQAAADGGEQPLARGGLPGDEEAGQWQGTSDCLFTPTALVASFVGHYL